MPVGKYYCDYCDKEFQDTPVARKRHLQSPTHLRAKFLWFKSLSSDVAIASAGAGVFVQGVCNRFVKTGFCPYGDSCKYLHPPGGQSNIKLHPSPNADVPQGFSGNPQPSIILGNAAVGGSSLPGNVVRGTMGTYWGNLPPSLRPPPEGGYPPLPFVDWG